MYDRKLFVQVIQSNQNMKANFLNHGDRQPTVIRVLNKRQKIVPKVLKHHADMLPIGTRMLEMVQKLHHTFLIVRVSLRNLLQNRYLIHGRLGIVLSTLLNLQSHIPLQISTHTKKKQNKTSQQNPKQKNSPNLVSTTAKTPIISFTDSRKNNQTNKN
ncbi:hypothetical protein V8G54_030372 [Vigna mungo]|uniref:Uncharacterized protein n=1 Tax=Vigna mungo TaxID=3915 RepID=A0AAQ3MW69_VIGMU